MSDYRGVWPVAPTPFAESGAVDLDAMKSVIDCIIDQGVDGVCILANYSEQFLLSDQERQVLTRLCLEYINGRIPAIVTISHYSTDIVVARAEEAHALGADMVMMMPPYHGALMRGTTEQIYDQFAAVSKIGIPIMVQDAPISGIDLPVDLLIRMAAEIEQVKCFKIESAQAASKLRRLVDEGGETIQGPFDGEEGITLLADLQAGATGNMPSALLPDLIIPVVTNHRLGNRQKAIDEYNRILPLINYENKQCGFRAAKTVMMEGNVIKSDRCRHPVPPLAPQVRTELLRLAREYQPLSLTWGK